MNNCALWLYAQFGLFAVLLICCTITTLKMVNRNGLSASWWLIGSLLVLYLNLVTANTLVNCSASVAH